jgi:hypothetical protein
MKRLIILAVVCCLLSGCALYQLDQLAGRHWIQHPETKEMVWAPYSISPKNWDKENTVWRYDDGTICGDGYLYDKEDSKQQTEVGK